jgi:hypothetical protein
MHSCDDSLLQNSGELILRKKRDFRQKIWAGRWSGNWAVTRKGPIADLTLSHVKLYRHGSTIQRFLKIFQEC